LTHIWLLIFSTHLKKSEVDATSAHIKMNPFRSSTAFPPSKYGEEDFTYFLEFKPKEARYEQQWLEKASDFSLVEKTNWQRFPLTPHTNEYDPKHLDIINLPLAIPGAGDVLCNDTLFIRHDDIKVFQALFQNRMSVLLGNPGIGKSWLHWPILLFFINPNVYQVLVKEDLPTLFQPKVVLRFTGGGERCTIWYLDERVVQDVRLGAFKPEDLASLFNSPTTLLLWEPEAGEPVVQIPWEGLDKMRIWATVSPNDGRYEKGFCMHGFGVKIFMPCPLPEELKYMGAYMKPNVPQLLTPLYEPKAIEDSIRRFGPFTRHVLPASKRAFETSMSNRSKAISGLTVDQRMAVMRLPTIESKEPKETKISHWFLKYEVDRSSPEAYFFPSVSMTFASEETLILAQDEFSRLSLQQLIQHFVDHHSHVSDVVDPLLL
jgi:hypothetical protein